MFDILTFLLPIIMFGLPIMFALIVIYTIHQYLTLFIDFLAMTPDEWVIRKAEFHRKHSRYGYLEVDFNSPDYTTDPGYHYLYENVHHKDN